MADITMCAGLNCPKKKKCYRYTAPINPYRQAYFGNLPYDFENNTCEHYWDNKEYKKNEKFK